MIIALHGHHHGLLSVLDSLETRIKEIKTNKARDQHEVRLRLIQQIPLKLLPRSIILAAKALDKANKARDKANKALDKANKARDKAWYKAGKAWDKARGKAWDKANKARDKAWDKANKARDKAWDKARGKAWDKADKARGNFAQECSTHHTALETLHKQLCISDCPWDGSRILPDF